MRVDLMNEHAPVLKDRIMDHQVVKIKSKEPLTCSLERAILRLHDHSSFLKTLDLFFQEAKLAVVAGFIGSRRVLLAKSFDFSHVSFFLKPSRWGELLKTGAAIDAEGLHQIGLRGKELDALLRVVVKMLEDNPVWPDRELDNIVRFPGMGNTVDHSMAFSFDHVNHSAALALLLAAETPRRDLLDGNNEGLNHGIVDGGMKVPLHFSLRVALPGEFVPLNQEDGAFFSLSLLIPVPDHLIVEVAGGELLFSIFRHHSGSSQSFIPDPYLGAIKGLLLIDFHLVAIHHETF